MNKDMEKFYRYEKTISKEKRVDLGIVYTPPEIVDYINSSALDMWNAPNPPKVLDPCCGTGVFLHDMAHKIAQRWNLPIEKVMKEYIYGVDKDGEAVEVCKELLGCEHIVQGNSLLLRLDAFDMIVTNPPYIRIQNLDQETRDLIKEKHPIAMGDTDIYIAFLDKFHASGKIVGLICPNSWIRNKSSNLLRDSFYREQRISKVIDYRSEMVFDNAQTYTSIVLMSPKAGDLEYGITHKEPLRKIQYDNSTSDIIYLGQQTDRDEEEGIDIFDFCDFKIGLATLCDGLFFCTVTEQNGGLCKIDNKFGSYEIEFGILRTCIKASKMSKKMKNTYIVFPYDAQGNLISEKDLSSSFPRTYAMLLENQQRLLSRDKGKIKKEKWYGFGRDQGLKNNVEKILLPPVQKGGLRVSESAQEEYYISGYGIIPKDGYTIQQVKSFIESEYCYDKVKDKAKTMSGGWIGLSKNTFKGIKVPKKFYISLDN